MYGFDDYDIYEEEYSVDAAREDLGRIVQYFKSQDYWEEAMTAFFVNYRKLPMEVAVAADAFAVDENTPVGSLPDWMKSEPLGFVKRDWIPMAGRCVLPVKDVMGNVAGFVGWDPFEKPKYLDSRNYGYKAKQTMLYGMEKMKEYYTSGKPVILTEGLMDTLYLRWKGFQALASLGSYLTPYIRVILNRFGDRLIAVPDNDETGDKYVEQCKRDLKRAIVMQVAYGKDIEGCRRVDDGKYEEQLLSELRSITNPFVRTNLLIRR